MGMLRVAMAGGAASVVLVACTALTGADDLRADLAESEVASGASTSSASSTSSSSTSSGSSGTTSSSSGTSSGTTSSTSSTSSSSSASSSGNVDAGDGAVTDAPCVLATQTRLGTTASGWFDADKALAPDKQPAHSGGTTAALIVGGYGFTLPATATIRGISVEIRRSAQGTVVDSSLVLSGADQSESRASPLPWPTGNLTTYFDQTYGGPADLWGRAWTAAEVTSASFGARLRVTASGDGHVDAITITVHYCP